MVLAYQGVKLEKENYRNGIDKIFSCIKTIIGERNGNGSCTMHWNR